jgi:copper(I)-binding protein
VSRIAAAFKPAVLAALLLTGAASALAQTPAAMLVVDAWIAAAPPTARHNAAYLTLKNGPRKDTLLAVSTPVAETAEIHEVSKADGLTRMQRRASIELAPNQELSFAPGGRHIMLINLRQPLPAGTQVPLALKFRHAGTIRVQAEVRPLPVDSLPAHDHHDHEHHAH